MNKLEDLQSLDKASYVVAWLRSATIMSDDSAGIVYDRVVGIIMFVLFFFWRATYHKIKRWFE